VKKILTAILLGALAGACAERERPAQPDPPNQEKQAREEPEAAPEVVEVGKPMPAYSAEMLDGSTFDVAGERGNVLFLNLWATWCGPCRYEIPELEKLHADHARQRFKVIGVSVDEGGDQVVREFVAEEKVNYPIVLDPQGRLSVLLDTNILPTSVIVDRTGRVVWKKFGVVSTRDEEMLRVLDQALKS
jgi:cytochrome c-type biogenesis protein